MILEKQTESHILEDSVAQQTTKMSLDLDSAQILMQMLSKNLYSDDIGSAVRECASNALDSHRRAGTDNPIIVSLKKSSTSDTIEFSVEDFGIGLDADDVVNIISKYGKSTKRNSNTELGMMGLGFKAPLAYSSSFYFVARKNGVERKYMMYEGEDTNSIDLLYEKPTSEGNGVKVIIPVDHSDRLQFANKIKEQLAYFESIYFNIDTRLVGTEIINDFVIYRADDYQFSSIANSKAMHLCLDNVYYPIDFDKLGIRSIDLPIALRFSLTDGLFPTPNREALRYTQEAKQIILDKISKVADVFMNKYNESINLKGNPVSIIEFYSETKRTIADFFGKSNGNRLNVTNLLTYSKVPFASPKMEGITLLDWRRLATHIKNFIFVQFESEFSFTRGKFRDETKRQYKTTLDYDDIKPRWGTTSIIYTFSDRFTKRKQDYLRTILPENCEYLFVKKKPLKLKKKSNVDYNSYVGLLELNKYPKAQWRQVITEFQTVIAEFEKNFIDLDKIEIPQSYIDKQKAKRVQVLEFAAGSTIRKVRMKGEFSGKVATKTENNLSDQYSKFVPTTFKFEEIKKVKMLYVYAKESDKKKMDNLWSLFRDQVKFVLVADKNFNNLQKADVHNWITMKKFMEGKNRPFRTMATVFLIDKFVDEYDDLFNRSAFVREVSSDLADKIDALQSYTKKHSHREYVDKDTRKDIISFATEHNLFDQPIYIIYKQVIEVNEKLPFLIPMLRQFVHHTKDPILVKAMADLFKYHKHKVNLSHYAIRLNEDKPLDKELTQETIDELQTI
jgi:hypothetical protein